MPAQIKRPKVQLLVVYNSNPGQFLGVMLNRLLSFFGFSRNSDLYWLINNPFGASKKWTLFCSSLSYKVGVINKNQFQTLFPEVKQRYAFPVILLYDRGIFVPVASGTQLSKILTTEELIDYLDKQLHKHSENNFLEK